MIPSLPFHMPLTVLGFPRCSFSALGVPRYSVFRFLGCCRTESLDLVVWSNSSALIILDGTELYTRVHIFLPEIRCASLALGLCFSCARAESSRISQSTNTFHRKGRLLRISPISADMTFLVMILSLVPSFLVAEYLQTTENLPVVT